jgi:hypothetical protein
MDDDDSNNTNNHHRMKIKLIELLIKLLNEEKY